MNARVASLFTKRLRTFKNSNKIPEMLGLRTYKDFTKMPKMFGIDGKYTVGRPRGKTVNLSLILLRLYTTYLALEKIVNIYIYIYIYVYICIYLCHIYIYIYIYMYI